MRVLKRLDCSKPEGFYTIISQFGDNDGGESEGRMLMRCCGGNNYDDDCLVARQFLSSVAVFFF